MFIIIPEKPEFSPNMRFEKLRSIMKSLLPVNESLFTMNAK